MYGHIHVILKDLVLSVAGPAQWRRILAEAKFDAVADEPSILDTIVQPDQVTYDLVAATCKVLKLSPEDALAAFGRHFVVFALRSGNARFLRAQGATLPTFLANVNRLHHHLERDHPDARFPYVEARHDPARQEVRLSYLSSRPGLASLLVGVVQEIGRRLYGLEVDFAPAELPEELRSAAAQGHSAAWTLTWRPLRGGPEGLSEAPEPAAAEPEAPRMSFVALHTAMADFARLVRTPDVWSRCACPARPAGEALELVNGAGSDSDGDFPVRKTASLKKMEEVERGGQPLERILLRGIRARHVAAAWSDPTLPRCRPFWQSSQGRAKDYCLSEDVRRVDVFVSHSWSAPENWALVMGPDVSHADVKSTTLAVMAKDIALMRSRLGDWRDVTFWVDKACIPQDNPILKEWCIQLIEKFIHDCDCICVLFTWSYLERLWCVFEWACVLVDKDPSRVWLQNELFVSEQSMPLYLENIRYFSLARTKCCLESDRAILRQKIDDCYVSHQAFEELVQATAVALMARSMAYRAGRSAHLLALFYRPWVELAEELGLAELAAALDACQPLHWREEAAPPVAAAADAQAQPVLLGRVGIHMGVSASKYHGQINRWFNAEVSPVLRSLRARAAKKP